MAHPKPAWLYAPKYALNTFSSTLTTMLPSTLSSGMTLSITLGYMFQSMLLVAQSRDLLSCWRQAAGVARREVGCGWWVAGGGSQYHNVGRYHSLNLTFSAATAAVSLMPHAHGVDSCSRTLDRKGQQLDRGEKGSPTQDIQWDLRPTSHRLWA
jgi:hypothetical protein